MIGKLLGLLITLIKLPIKLVLLPFKAISFLMSLVFYVAVLAVAGGLIYVFLL